MTNEEINYAMQAFTPVVHNGIKYRRISAITKRIALIPGTTNKYHVIVQVELESVQGNAVMIVPADEVELMK